MIAGTDHAKKTPPTVEDYEEIGQLVINALRAIRALIERVCPEAQATPRRSPTLAEMGALYVLCAELRHFDRDPRGHRTIENLEAALEALDALRSEAKPGAAVAA
jgi:hypothetical protein